MKPWPLSFTLLVVSNVTLFALPIPINGPGVYSQDFDSLESTGNSSSLPGGWELAESGSAANTTYAAGTGSSSTADTYSFGAAGNSDRALGTLQSGSLVSIIGASFVNGMASPINKLSVAFMGEQWRLGATGRADRLDFQYSLDATSLTTGTWVDVDALDFSSPNTGPTTGALNGNDAANQANRSATLTGLNWAPGSTLYIRWTDLNASGSDDGLAVDSFTIQASEQRAQAMPERLPSSYLSLALLAMIGVRQWMSGWRAGI